MDSFQSKFTSKTTKYVINGREYDSLDEVPEQFRAMFEDRDGDGCPDWIQDKMASAVGHFSSQRIEVRSAGGVTTYKVGDREYQSLDEMPAEHRALFERLGRDGLPDGFPTPFGGPVLDVASRAPLSRDFVACEQRVGGTNPAEDMPVGAPRHRDSSAPARQFGRKNRVDAVGAFFFLGFAILVGVVLAVCWALFR